MKKYTKDMIHVDRHFPTDATLTVEGTGIEFAIEGLGWMILSSIQDGHPIPERALPHLIELSRAYPVAFDVFSLNRVTP